MIASPTPNAKIAAAAEKIDFFDGRGMFVVFVRDRRVVQPRSFVQVIAVNVLCVRLR